MKPFHTVVFALTLSFAGAQGQPVTRAADLPDSQTPAEKAVSRTISADLLRQPLSRKAKQILQKAQHAADAGDRVRAIGFLETALAKYPESAAWTQSMLGVEYLKTDRLAAALASLEQAVLLLPRDAADRSNLGFALASTGQYDRAEREVRRALALDHSNLKAQQLLDVVLANLRKPPAQTQLSTASNPSSSR
jgi:tetratricopeptide (TPR) repeat protein